MRKAIWYLPMAAKECPDCAGQGWIGDKKCKRCAGRGLINE